MISLSCINIRSETCDHTPIYIILLLELADNSV